MLVAAAPGRPVQAAGGVACWLDGQGGEEAGDLVAGERDLARWRAGCSLGCGGQGEEGGGEDGQGGPAVPGGPGADLVLVQAGQAFAGLGWVGRTARCPWRGSFS